VTFPPHEPRKLRRAARQFADAVQTGECPSDRAFDRFLPERLRTVSSEFWSPLAVARRAVEWFDAAGVQSVVDVGSGAGKFCVAGALFGRCHFVGLEQRPFLVKSARGLARLFDVNDRVRFVLGSLGDVPIPVADAYYFFNPFGDYSVGLHPRAEQSQAIVWEQYARDVAAAEELLRGAPAGTSVLALNGFGGRLPPGYDLIHVDWSAPGGLRMWRKG
jgi:SAM-dependent methyltransferase